MERMPRGIYTKELREEAVKLVTEGGLSIPEVGRRLSVSPSTIRYWVKANREGELKEVGKQQRPLTDVEMELARCPGQARAGGGPDGARYIKKSGCVLCERIAARCAIMKAMRFKYGVAVMCVILHVSKSGYYKWLNRKPSRRVLEEGRLEVEIKAVHKRTLETCGPESLQHEFRDQGVSAGICRIR